MSKIQRVIVILVAFGVVSIVMSQVNDYYSDSSTASSISVGYKEEKFSGNTVVIQANDPQEPAADISRQPSKSLNNNKRLDKASQIVTNIYQTTNGSFYFEVEPNKIVHHTNSVSDISSDAVTEHIRQFLPSTLAETSAEVTISGPIARTKLTQTFKNESNQTRSGIYVFPLPEDAAVDSLVMTIGDRKIIGEIKRKKTAQEIFQEAKKLGKRASLVSQVRPNIFTSQVANIPAFGSIDVTIEYQQLVKHENTHFSLRLPLSITPRYTPTSADGHHENKADTTFLMQPYLDSTTNIQVNIQSGIPVTNIESEHHPIRVSNDQHVYNISLDTTRPVNKDFVLNWSLQQGLNIQAEHLKFSDNNYDYGLITLVPPKLPKLMSPRQVIFVLDVSGSMVGESLTQAKKSIAMAINDLNQNDYFNLVSFHSHASSLFKSSKPAKHEYKEQALDYLYKLEANGGTEIKSALDIVFEHTEKDNVLNQVLFVTDGSVSNEQELLADIHKKLGDFRLFTVGIGSAPNSYFMTESAYVGKGTYTFIGDINHVETKMTDLLNTLKYPALTNLTLEFEDTAKAFEFEIFPAVLPDLYSSEFLHISYRKNKSDKFNDSLNPSAQNSDANSYELLNDLSSLRINGEFLVENSNNSLVMREWSNSLPIYNIKTASGLDKHWARQKIRALTTQRYKASRQGTQDTIKFSENINEHITQLALKYSLVSEFTSLVAVESSTKDIVQNAQRKELSARIARLPQTSTNSLLSLLLGVFILSILLLSLNFKVIQKTHYQQNNLV